MAFKFLAAVAALAAIHFLDRTKLIFIPASGNEAKPASFSGSGAKVKQPLRYISLICSYHAYIPIEVHYI